MVLRVWPENWHVVASRHTPNNLKKRRSWGAFRHRHQTRQQCHTSYVIRFLCSRQQSSNLQICSALKRPGQTLLTLMIRAWVNEWIYYRAIHENLPTLRWNLDPKTYWFVWSGLADHLTSDQSIPITILQNGIWLEGNWGSYRMIFTSLCTVFNQSLEQVHSGAISALGIVRWRLGHNVTRFECKFQN